MEIKDFTSLLETPLNSLLKNIGNELKQIAKNRILEYQQIEFRRNFFSKTLLHRSEPVKLTDFYLPLHIAPVKDFTKRYDSLERISTEKVKNLFTKTNFITLIGNAGSGKSTIVKYLYINSVQTSFKIPIKVELRYLNDFKGTLSEYIFDEIFLFYKLGFTAEIIDRLLTSDSFIFFFDGYDEVNFAKKESFTNDLDKFVTRYPQNFYVVTSRPYTNIEILPLFKNFVVCDLASDEIPAFVKKQTSAAEEELSEKMIQAINQIDNRSYRTFLQNPLLLSMFILTFQSYSEIPQKRSDFYKQVFDTLYSVHDSVSKLSFVREKTSGLSREKFEDILKLFSFISYFESKFLFKLEYLEQKLNLIKEKKSHLIFDNDKVIQDLQIAIGILNKEGVDYTFPHRSLQEYFSANYLSSLNETNKKIIFTKIKDYIENKWMYIIDNQHFLLLLAEQDYNSVLKFIAVPLLQNEVSRVCKLSNVTTAEKYDVQCKIYLIALRILQESIRKEKIHEEFCGSFSPDAIYFGNNNFTFSFQKDKIGEMTKKVLLAGIQIAENGQIWIDEILNNITKDEKSDTEIIEII